MKTEPQNQPSNTTATTTAPASAPKRRMRRRACPQSDHDSRSERLSSGTTLVAGLGSQIKNQKSEIPPLHNRRARSRPFQPLPEFAHLRPDQLDFIHDLFRTRTLEDIKQQLYMDLGANLSIATLHRYRTQLNLAYQLQVSDDTKPAVDHLRDLYAARPTQLDAAGLQIIKQRALELAASPKTSPSLFKDLHRIFTYEDRKQEKQNTIELRHAQRLELANLREQTRLQISADRRATQDQNLAHRQQNDLAKLQLGRDRHALELRKQEHREKLAAQKAPQNSTIDEAREKVEALLAYGREYLRQEREKDAARLAAQSPNPTPSEENCPRIQT